MPTEVTTLETPVMAANSNGAVMSPSKGKQNGYAVGRKIPAKQKAGLAGKTSGLIARLVIWYAIITAIFRCPSTSSSLTEDSPKVCKPYLTIRSHVTPYIEPYYDTYAAPYVDKFQPYADKFNTQLYSPSVQFGKKSYESYGAPRVDQARAFTQDKWERVLKPHIDTAQVRAKKQYDSTLAPHVNKASAAVQPYYTSSRDGASQIYISHLLPAFESARPYIERTYGTGYKLIVEKGVPYARIAGGSTMVFFDRTVWPKLRILYGENVEPQLVRIGERLGRYRDGKKLKAAMDDAEVTSTLSSISSSFSSVAASVTPTIMDTSSSTVDPSTTPEQEVKQKRENIESDLKIWQDKFAKAADKGAENLEERVKEITDRQIKSQVDGVGEALIIQLEETSKSELTKVKHEIILLVKKFPEEYDEDDLAKAELSLSRFIKSAGQAVKEKAQALRSWRESFDMETQSLINAASDSTLDIIDNIRDLGLQEIGLRWAQMEGVTYKDWSKYHEVKKTFDEWRVKVEAVAQDHEGLRKSKESSDDVEARGMVAAEETAKELIRLKDVGKWKMEAGDISEDFTTKYVPPVAVAGAQKVMEKVHSASEEVIGTSQGTVESFASQATEQASAAASSVSSAVIGTEPGMVEKGKSKLQEAANTILEQASEVISGMYISKRHVQTQSPIEYVILTVKCV